MVKVFLKPHKESFIPNRSQMLVPDLYYQIIWILAACSGSVSMQESMSHHIFPQLLSLPLWSQLNNIMNEDLKFHEDYMKEAADLTFLSYRHCNYSKVVEFVKFRKHMQNSHHFSLVRIE